MKCCWNLFVLTEKISERRGNREIWDNVVRYYGVGMNTELTNSVHKVREQERAAKKAELEKSKANLADLKKFMGMS